NRQPVESSLPGGGSETGVVRAIEGVEERVTLGIDLVSGAERTAQPLTVFLERLPYASAPSSASKRVDCSTSVKRNVTVPLGSSTMRELSQVSEVISLGCS